MFLFLVLKNAWVADDAYIAFRSIEQLFAGNGLRWNFDERVQVYTSPLWFGLLALIRVVTANLFLGAIVLSTLCCAGMLVFARNAIGDSRRWLVFVLLIAGSWSVMDFTTSGLENPLLFLLLSAFVYCYSAFCRASAAIERQQHYTRLMIVLGMLSIARHDMATLVLAPSLYAMYIMWRNSDVRVVMRNLLYVLVPLLAWTFFSIIYYGAPFPNTAYAKLSHGVPRADLIDFGKLYLEVSLKFDVFSMLALLALLMRMTWKREPALVALGCGVVLNLLYVLYVGGDFMQGRFISEAILFAALAALLPPFLQNHPASKTAERPLVVIAAAGLAVLMLWCETPLKLAPDSGFDISEGRRHYSWRGILNERNFYFKTNSLWAYVQYKKSHRDERQPFPDHKWCRMGEEARAQGKSTSEFGGIGMYGYCAGLELVVIDNLGLGEPFFARLPKTAGHPWRAGHFHRDAPRGYLESRMSGENHIVDPELAQLWADVTQLVRAPLFTAERWRAIWRVNTGYYRDIGPAYQADIAAQSAAVPLEKDDADTIAD